MAKTCPTFWSAAVKQVGGRHYEDMPQGVQPFDIILAHELDYFRGNAIKYVLRAGTKSGSSYVEDLKKAIHYLTYLIERVESDE